MLDNLKKFSLTNKIATIYEGIELSYCSLYKRIQALAWYLLDNYNTDKPIVIYGDKENDMIVAFFACIIAKKTYVTLPSVYPKNRLDYIIKDCCPDIMFNASNNKYFDNEEIKEINSNDVDKFIDLYKNKQELEYKNDEV